MIRIRSVEPLKDFNVQLTFTDGSQRVVDLSSYLRGPIFAEIRQDPRVFNSLRVDPEAHWPAAKRTRMKTWDTVIASHAPSARLRTGSGRRGNRVREPAHAPTTIASPPHGWLAMTDNRRPFSWERRAKNLWGWKRGWRNFAVPD